MSGPSPEPGSGGGRARAYRESPAKARGGGGAAGRGPRRGYQHRRGGPPARACHASGQHRTRGLPPGLVCRPADLRRDGRARAAAPAVNPSFAVGLRSRGCPEPALAVLPRPIPPLPSLGSRPLCRTALLSPASGQPGRRLYHRSTFSPPLSREISVRANSSILTRPYFDTPPGIISFLIVSRAADSSIDIWHCHFTKCPRSHRFGAAVYSGALATRSAAAFVRRRSSASIILAHRRRLFSTDFSTISHLLLEHMFY